jgi:hypothetical protein
MPNDTHPIGGDRPPEAEAKPGRKAKSKAKVRLLTLDDLDGRTVAAKRVQETIGAIETDLGGAEGLSTLERALVTDAAILDGMLTDAATHWFNGRPVDPTIYCTLLNARRRAAETLGLARRAKDVTPALESFLASKKPKPTTAEAA